MHVRCVCNQTYTFCEVQFPHRVSCFACGRKWMVLEDGTVDQIRPKTIHLSCRCGQPFTVNAIQFPRKLHCVTCKRRFSVFDTGEIIDTNEELPITRPAATAIEDKSANELRKAYGSTAIRAQIPRFEADNRAKPKKSYVPASGKSPGLSRPKNMKDELALIDLRWRIERMSFALFDSFGIVIFASRKLSFILAVVCVALSCAAWLFLWKSNEGMRPCIGVFIGILQGLLFAPVAILLRYARKYEDAETEWLRQRWGVIEKYELSASTANRTPEGLG